MTVFPPEPSPIEGTPAAPRKTPDGDQWTETLHAGRKLAVVYVSVTIDADDSNDLPEAGPKRVNVYQGTDEGDWTQILIIWNQGV